jgi:hypothetical protein
VGGGLIILAEIIETEGPVAEEEAVAAWEAVAAEAEVIGQDIEVAAQEVEAQGKAIFNEIEQALESGEVEEVSTACEENPGAWESENESMSETAQEYQSQITGKGPGEVYRVGDVKFDGYSDGTLLDAKGPGYAKFVQADGTFQPWFKGADSLLDQAQRQVAAAGGTPIVWHVAEEPAAEAIRNLLSENGVSGVQVVWTPVAP